MRTNFWARERQFERGQFTERKELPIVRTGADERAWSGKTVVNGISVVTVPSRNHWL